MRSVKKYASLMIWIAVVLGVGFTIGSLTKNSVNTWYITLNRSSLTPPDYIFGIAWSILYVMIAASGWLFWRQKACRGLNSLKTAYIVQLMLNWCWTPLFFIYHLTGIALICLMAILLLLGFIIIKAYKTLKTAVLLLLPYLLWLLFAAYLNFYVWQYN